MALNQNSAPLFNLREKMLGGGVKIAKMVLFQTNQWEILSCITYPKINLLGQLVGEIWEVFPFLILKNAGSFLSQHPTKLSQEAKIWNVHLTKALDVSFGGFNFSAPFHPLTVLNTCFFGQFFLFIEFALRIVSLQIELRI